MEKVLQLTKQELISIGSTTKKVGPKSAHSEQTAVCVKKIAKQLSCNGGGKFAQTCGRGMALEKFYIYE